MLQNRDALCLLYRVFIELRMWGDDVVWQTGASQDRQKDTLT